MRIKARTALVELYIAMQVIPANIVLWRLWRFVAATPTKRSSPAADYFRSFNWSPCMIDVRAVFAVV